MLNELKRYNNVGDVNGITYFLKLVLSDLKIQKCSAQKLCALRNNMRLNFPAVVLLFKYLGIIKEKSGYLYPTGIGKELITSNNLETEFCRLCFKKIISDDLLDIATVHYNININEYIIEKQGFPVLAAVFRNTLLQYHALQEYSGSLVISTEYESIFADYQKRYKTRMSLEKLKDQIEEQEKQGEKAEQFVLAFEAKRLINHLKVNNIKRISTIDVTAGYDILSYEDNESLKFDRFIEVKSYKGNPHFYWSQNEIETAKLYEEKYFIYLIDALKVDEPGYKPLIIRNPAVNIFESDSWIMNPTSYIVIPTDIDS